MIKVHRYRAKNLPKMELFGSGTEVQRYTAQVVSSKSLFWDQVQRYKGTELEVSSNFSDLQGDKLIMGRLKMNVT